MKTKKTSIIGYTAIIHEDPKGNFGISFPDFPGCIAVEDSYEKVEQAGLEVLILHINGMIEDKEIILKQLKR